MSTLSILLPTCANWIPGTWPCERRGDKACGNCKLVVYCGLDCQKAHWPEHRKACRSALAKDNWRPAWDREGRKPPWTTGAASKNWHNAFGGEQYLWGNTPAMDILKLEQNEGIQYREDLELLFAASGDLRHVVKTVASLPDKMTQRINVTLNDRGFDVVARNVLLLLLALSAPGTSDMKGTTSLSDTAEDLIHLWYSASISSSLLSRLQDRVKPLIVEVCSQIANKPPNTVLGKIWTFPGGQSLRLSLKQKDWLQLQRLIDIPDGMTFEDATKTRTAVTLAPERVDYRDRWYFNDASPFMRIAKQRFREDGLLLPFGHPRVGFRIPNPTFFHTSNTWPMDDKADPSNGWPILHVQHTSSPAPRDWYGKLYIFLHKMFTRFLHRLEKTRIGFTLYNIDVKELPQHLETNKYSRIEVANICDGGYIGIRNTLSLLSPLLQSPRQSPHATLITLFIHAVAEVVKMGGSVDETPDTEFLLKYLPSPQISTPRSRNNADILRIWDARALALNLGLHFKRYMVFHNFKQISTDLCVKMKKSNTVIEKWPTRLKLRPGQEGAEEEFRLNLASGFMNTERYVEWSRVE